MIKEKRQTQKELSIKNSEEVGLNYFMAKPENINKNRGKSPTWKS